MPPLESWPSGGYTYCCWFRVEDFHDPKLRASDHSYEPRLLRCPLPLTPDHHLVPFQELTEGDLRTLSSSLHPLHLCSVLSDTGSGLEVFFVANDLFMVTHHAGQQSTMPIPFNHSFRVKVSLQSPMALHHSFRRNGSNLLVVACRRGISSLSGMCNTGGRQARSSSSSMGKWYICACRRRFHVAPCADVDSWRRSTTPSVNTQAWRGEPMRGLART